MAKSQPLFSDGISAYPSEEPWDRERGTQVWHGVRDAIPKASVRGISCPVPVFGVPCRYDYEHERPGGLILICPKLSALGCCLGPFPGY